jgi:Family of unknown function (DUF6176)
MSLYAFTAPIQPGKTEEFRQFVADLGGSKKRDYETARENAGFHRETIFLQTTPKGEMVVVVQEAENAQKAWESLAGMKDPFNMWFFQRLKDIHGIDVVGSDVPRNEVLLDYRPE